MNPIDPHGDYYPGTTPPPYRPQRRPVPADIAALEPDPHAPTLLERIGARLMEASRCLYALPNCTSPACAAAYEAIGDAILLTSPRLSLVMEVDEAALWLQLAGAVEFAAKRLDAIDCDGAKAFVAMALRLAQAEAARVEAEAVPQ